MDWKRFPEEIIEEIVQYLSAEDLLNCTLVCVYFRNVLNNNRIWYRLCKHFANDINKLDWIENPNKIEPKFVPPSNANDNLSDLCQWRLRFMQELNLIYNWRNGKIISEVITSPQVNPFVVECDDSFLLISSLEERQFKIWNMENNVEEKDPIYYSLRHVLADFFKLCNNRLIVVQCTLMQVFDKTCDGSFKLTNRFLFDKSYEDSINIPTNSDISDWYNNNIGLYPSDLNMTCDHNGKYFIGAVLEQTLNQTNFHIWDIERGLKITEKYLIDIENVDNFNLSLHNYYLYFMVNHRANHSEGTKIFCYDLKSFEYTTLKLDYDYVVPIVIFSDKFVINSDAEGKTLHFWNYNDGSFVHSLSCQWPLCPMTLQFAFNYVIFAEISGTLGRVKVFDTNSMTTASEFSVHYIIKNLAFIRPNMLLVGGWKGLGLWDITTTNYLMKFDGCLYCIHTHSCRTKMVIESSSGELILMHFW